MALSGIIGNAPSVAGIFIEDFQFPFALASGIAVADVGKAVALDTSAANTVKLAADGDVIIGRLEVVENRGAAASGTLGHSAEGNLIGTVSLYGGMTFPYTTDAAESADVPAIGDVIVGAEVGSEAHPKYGTGSGFVKKTAIYVDTDGSGSPTVTRAKVAVNWVVTEVNTTAKTCTAVKM